MPPPCKHEPRVSKTCHLCNLYETRADYRAMWDGEAPPAKLARRALSTPAPCRHLGAETGETRPCPSCTGTLQVPFRACAIHGQCTETKLITGVECCAICKDRSPAAAPVRLPAREVVEPASLVARFDEQNLAPNVPGKRFNGSILDYQDGYLLAFRNGWAGSEIYLIRLDKDFKPKSEAWKLDLRHKEANYGREDPRLFMHQGKVHVSFIGVVGGRRIRHTSQLYARLGDDLRAERVFYPHYAKRNGWEKNHSFYSFEGQLYASYSTTPHQVLKIDDDRAELVYSSPFPAPWTGGEIRGGAAPVLVGDEFWCFGHDRIERNGIPTYRALLWTFQARPPFRISRYVPYPILTADHSSNPGNYADVVWPGGCVRVGDDWVMAVGIHDRTQSLYRLSHQELEKKLVWVSPPPWFLLRWNTDDPPVFSYVAGQNEYQLPENMNGHAVLDVGGSFGAFLFACHERGAALVHSYEPWKKSLSILKRNAEQLRERGTTRIVVFDEAVGPSDGVATYHEAAKRSTASGVALPAASGGTRMVSLDKAIDRLLTGSGKDRVELVKVDCEGAEYAVLRACKSWDKVERVVMEYHRGTQDLPALFQANGFVVSTKVDQGGRGHLYAWRGPVRAPAVTQARPPIRTPPAFCITCSQHPERGEAALSHFQEQSLDVRFFEGLYGPELGIRPTREATPGYIMAPGHTGCFLSHLALWRSLAMMSFEEALIFEDDVSLVPDFKTRLAEAMAELPSDWQFVYVGGLFTDEEVSEKLSLRVGVVRYPNGTHAYLAKREAILHLIKTNQEARTHVDIQIAQNSLPGLKTYVLVPTLARQHTVDGRWPSTT